MGKRVCGMRCHTAKRPKCRCWCAGLFHGSARGHDAGATPEQQAAARAAGAFTSAWGDRPKGEVVGGGDRWAAAVQAARAAAVAVA